MPSLVRLKTKIVTLLFIAFTYLQISIAKPTGLGEGESQSELNSFSNPLVQLPSVSDSYFNRYGSGNYPNQQNQFQQSFNYPNKFQFGNAYAPQSPFQQMTNLDGSNVQINYRDEKLLNGDDSTELVEASLLTSGQVEDENEKNVNLHRRFYNDDLKKKLNHEINNPSGARGANELLSVNNGRHSPVNFEIRDSIHLVSPKYVAKLILVPLKGQTINVEKSSHPLEASVKNFNKDPEFVNSQQTIKIKSLTPSSDKAVTVLTPETGENDAKKQSEEKVDIPTQDVGETEENLVNEDESMKADSSNNIAYSYSHYIPNYQPIPVRFSENNNFGRQEVPPMSIIFHPTGLQGSQPEIVLQELKMFALQLAQSPIMNAIFSPSNVPNPSKSLAWPSRYEAHKYLPPNNNPATRQYQDSNLRRSLVQVDTNGLSPEILEQLRVDKTAPSRFAANAVQNYLGPNVVSFNQFMDKSLQYPKEQANQAFDNSAQIFNRGSQAFDRNSGLLNNFFNQQLQLPQFPNFPNFSNQNQYRGYVAPRLRGITPNLPQFHPFSVPYISPSLRNIDLDPTDDIDVRMDTRSDSVDGINKNLSQTRIQLIQIGTGNKNIHDTVKEAKDEDFVENDERNVESHANNPMKGDDEVVNLKTDIRDEPVKSDEKMNQNVASNSRDNFDIEEVADATTVLNEDFINPETVDRISVDVAEDLGVKNSVNDETSLKNDDYVESSTTNIAVDDELPEINQAIEKENLKNPTSKNCSRTADDEIADTTAANGEFLTLFTVQFDDDTTNEYLQTETLNDDSTTTDPSEFETTTDPFGLDNRLDANVIRTLAG